MIFPPLVMRNSLGSGQAGVWLSSRFTARGDRISMPCAPSPPSTFCQENVVASSLSQGRSIAKAALVASQIVSPARVAGMALPFGRRTPLVVPFQVKTTSRSKSTCAKSTIAP